jgi:SAM-dependent methyltransferase
MSVQISTNQSMSVNQDGVCLHIGCGLNAPQGWENIDASPSLKVSKIPMLGRYILSLNRGPNWSATVRYGDIARGLKHGVDSCDLVFAAHVLEHLSLADFHTALKNIHSYLKPEGIFRFIVPDLKQYVDDYINRHADSASSGRAAIEFMQESLIGHMGSRKSLNRRLREVFSNSRHQWMWDKPSLLSALSQQGFRDARQCHYGDWSDPRFGSVEKKENYLHALGIEALK